MIKTVPMRTDPQLVNELKVMIEMLMQQLQQQWNGKTDDDRTEQKLAGRAGT